MLLESAAAGLFKVIWAEELFLDPAADFIERQASGQLCASLINPD